MTFTEAIARLRSYPEFRVVMEEIYKQRPTIMPMDPGKDLQKEAARLLYVSGEQNGFDNLMVILRGKHDPRS